MSRRSAAGESTPQEPRAVAARSAATLLAAALAVASASGVSAQQGPRFYPDDPIWHDDDMLDSEQPAEDELGQWYDFLSNQFGDPGKGDEGPALDANTLGEVPDSSWFTNRIGRYEIGPEQAAVGAVVHGPPAGRKWRIVGRPGDGVTAKFTIEDEHGDRYLIKFDPLESPGTVSTAETVASRLFYLAGYNTPENSVVDVDMSDLTIAPGTTFRDSLGYDRPLTWEDIHEWLRNVPRNADGTIRVTASRWLDGVPVGPFRYYGTRPDDPNDLFPHQRRRALRGVRVFGAWLNHDDSRAINTGDFYVQEGGRRFVRHYLMDFGSTMGASSIYLQPRRGGYEYFVEADKILKSIFTLGLWERPWAKVEYELLYGVGRFEADYFQPWLWKPNYPNPTFDRLDAADAFWAARILSRISDAHIEAIVREAKLPPESHRYLVRTLIRRRDKCVRYWISRTNPLDSFVVEGTLAAEGGPPAESRRAAAGGPAPRVPSTLGGPPAATLRFDNAAVRLGAAAPGGQVRARFARLDNDTGSETPVAEEVTVGAAALGPPFPGGLPFFVALPPAAFGPADAHGDRYAIARLSVRHPDFPQWRHEITVTVRARAGSLEVVGIERPPLPLDYAPDLRVVEGI